MEGTINFWSTVGVGTTFEISVPLAPCWTLPAPQPLEPAPASTGQIRLVVAFRRPGLQDAVLQLAECLGVTAEAVTESTAGGVWLEAAKRAAEGFADLSAPQQASASGQSASPDSAVREVPTNAPKRVVASQQPHPVAAEFAQAFGTRASLEAPSSVYSESGGVGGSAGVRAVAVVDCALLIAAARLGLRLPHPQLPVIACGRYSEREQLKAAAPDFPVDRLFAVRPLKAAALWQSVLAALDTGSAGPASSGGRGLPLAGTLEDRFAGQATNASAGGSWLDLERPVSGTGPSSVAPHRASAAGESGRSYQDNLGGEAIAALQRIGSASAGSVEVEQRAARESITNRAMHHPPAGGSPPARAPEAPSPSPPSKQRCESSEPHRSSRPALAEPASGGSAGDTPVRLVDKLRILVVDDLQVNCKARC